MLLAWRPASCWRVPRRAGPGWRLPRRPLIAAGKVRDDDAQPFQLERRRQQVGDRVDRHVGEGAAADGLGHAVPEIGRQFVEQDQGRLVADQVCPILLVRRLRAALVEFDEFCGLAELWAMSPQRCLSREIDRPEIATTRAFSA